eukprot:CAMPEP_0194241832 /NCGR_PEP_ID=MMETSP0158-20130606/7564_1 /TAXON_ID=33649 /ORGANISM="Thalassionema nitzschioides, Strain L26-B" /LENGTH=566 /DNA_ID=CAMNT_0038976805 /DNA_START=340 /DNA_END=2040 /DNA_ORIENTATION=+
MSVICKHWHSLVNAPCLWPSTVVANESCNIKHPSSNIRGVLDESVASALIGFRKLRSSRELLQSETSYQVMERATQQLYVIRQVRNISDRHDVSRHLDISHQLLGHDLWENEAGKSISEFSKYCHANILLPIGFEYLRNSLLIWYKNESCFETLQQWFETNDQCINPRIDRPPPTKPPISLQQVRAWFRELLQGIDILETYCNLCHAQKQSWDVKLDKIALDGRTGRLRLILTTPGQITDERKSNPDLCSIAQIIAQICRSGKPLPELPNAKKDQKCSAWFDWLQQHVPGLNDQGIDLLVQIFSSKYQISTKDALQHPFLSYLYAPTADITSLNRLRWRETFLPIKKSDLRPNERAVIVDWLVEVCLVFDFPERTVYRAMGYFEIMINSSETHIDPGRFQLLAGTCFLIATKLETQSSAMGAFDLAYCADNAFGQDEILKAERFIFQVLGWKLSHPTVLDFLAQYVSQLPNCCTAREFDMMLYVAQLALHLPPLSPSVTAKQVITIAYYALYQRVVLPEDADLVLANTFCFKLRRLQETMPELKATVRSFTSRNDVTKISIPRLIS